jgi:hypothetical protein
MDGANAQVGRDIMLGYPLDDMRSFLYKIDITLLRRIPDPGEEFIHVMTLPLKGDVQHRLQKLRIFFQLFYHLMEDALGEDLHGGGFNGLDGKDAGDTFLKTFQRSNALVLKKELYGRVFPVIVKPKPETTLFDEIIVLSGFALLQQDRPGRKDLPLLQRSIFIPKRGQVWKPVFEGKDQGTKIRKSSDGLAGLSPGRA